jgi:chromate transporter
VRLTELARLFLRLGVTAFGGPAAHIALMQEEIVERRAWLTREQFLDLISAANLIPGPNSTEVAMHVGFVRARWRGLVIAGACFILPAALIVAAIAVLYVRYAALPAVAGHLYAVKPVVNAIVVQAIWRLAAAALKTPMLIALCLVTTAAALAGVDELLLLAIAAGAMIAVKRLQQPVAMFAAVPSALAAAAPQFGLLPLFLFFLKVGSVLFGSGYVLVAFLRRDLVERWGWLTDRQLLDAVAIGQVTPGPVFTTATFIGYILGGSAGAVLATIGIFLPAFIFVALSARFVERARRSPVFGAALDGVNAASLALMIAVTWQLGRSAIVDVPTILIAAISAVALLVFRINPTWLVAGAATAGWVMSVL